MDPLPEWKRSRPVFLHKTHYNRSSFSDHVCHHPHTHTRTPFQPKWTQRQIQSQKKTSQAQTQARTTPPSTPAFKRACTPQYIHACTTHRHNTRTHAHAHAHKHTHIHTHTHTHSLPPQPLHEPPALKWAWPPSSPAVQSTPRKLPRRSRTLGMRAC